MTDQVGTEAALACPVCGAPYEAGDRFCETCGSPLPGAAPSAEAADGRQTHIPGQVGTGAETSAGSATGDGGRADAGVEGGVTARPGDDSDGNGAAPGTTDAPPAVATSLSLPTAPAVPPARTEPCVRCGAPPEDIDEDGYCTVCGTLQPGPRDHMELDLGWAAGITDRGRRHPHNEDAFHVELAGPEADRGIVAVVCDGVSSSERADDAAEAAAGAAGTVLAAVVGGAGSLADATVHAADAATQAVAALPWVPKHNLGSPSCTLVSAAYRRGEVAVGWLGDSRAYWLGTSPDDLRQLTVDDSWAEAQIESGRMTEVEADADPRSHAITRWIGADAPPVDAQVVTLSPSSGGRLLLCSDGLWNYAPTTADMAKLLSQQPIGATPLQLARSLTDFALGAGGHDNITVVVIDLPTTPVDGAEESEKGTA